eukprot:3281271-Alexandrium_andersonii.AAC.1
MRWQSRQAVWQADWTPTAASRALLAAYGRRQAPELDQAEPSLAGIRRLAPTGCPTSCSILAATSSPS